MLKSEKVKFISNYLNNLYPKTPVPLNHKNVFELLIAVLLSAQCTDERVNQVTPSLFKIANNPLNMSKLSIEEIYSIIKPCGLGPQKSKAIYNLSIMLIKNFNGDVPKTFNDLESLPGVGHKTASVVMSQGFGNAAFPVDTHIHRLAQRWGLTNGRSVKQTEKDLKKNFPKDDWNKLHLQIIFYGREHCTARGCLGIKCKICKTLYPKRKRPFRTKK